jgi:AraC-like DNA-binding protein
MIRTILLLTPVYITLFWSILLNFKLGPKSVAQRFLGKFMLACVVVYTTHFFYYSRLSTLLVFVEPLYQLASLSVYPLFYIYFRLLFVDPTFQVRKHGIYLVIPVLLAVLYGTIECLVPIELFKGWLYKSEPLPVHPALSLLKALMFVIALVNVVQILFTVIANLRLINSHRKIARNFFSDFYDIQTQTVVALNVVLVVCGLSSIALNILGRYFFYSEMTGIALASVVFSTMLFAIGWLGIGQNAVNPTFQESNSLATEDSADDLPIDHRHRLMENITELFRKERIHLNTKLTIQDVAQLVGTNRTYVSSIINQQYGVNFCTYVNNFRMDELNNVLKKNPHMTNQNLAESCGFGSVDSLKRAVHAKTGLSVSQWKANLIRKD